MFTTLSSKAKTVGVPKEIKTHEYRVALTPRGVNSLVKGGARVFVEYGAGIGAGYTDSDYVRSGGIVATKEDVFNFSDIIVKVKEPQMCEYGFFKKGQIVFTFFHFAGCPGLADAMTDAGTLCFAYETVRKKDGSFPILAPMSEIAGRLAIQEGMHHITCLGGGPGQLLPGVPGVEPSVVTIIGGGTVGFNAASMAGALGATVYILDNNTERLRQLSHILPKNVIPIYSTNSSLDTYLSMADIAVGAVLIPGMEAPKLVTYDMLNNMRKGSVFMDVAIDQGGTTQASRPTTHSHPTFKLQTVTMYCVPNMPGIVPVTATKALENATLPYLEALTFMDTHDAIFRYPDLGGSLFT